MHTYTTHLHMPPLRWLWNHAKQLGPMPIQRAWIMKKRFATNECGECYSKELYVGWKGNPILNGLSCLAIRFQRINSTVSCSIVSLNHNSFSIWACIIRWKPQKNHWVRVVEIPCTEDPWQWGQLHCPSSREVKGGLMHVMCQPR